MPTGADDVPVTSPDDPRLRFEHDGIAGADQIAYWLSLTPRERLQLLVEMVEFEDRLHRARLLPQER
jgi:hypothetical protein